MVYRKKYQTDKLADGLMTGNPDEKGNEIIDRIRTLQGTWIADKG